MFGSCHKEPLTVFLQTHVHAQSLPRHTDVLKSFFLHSTSEAYPSCTVTDIRFCFNVHKLMRLDLERYSNCYRLQQRILWSVWDCCLTMLMCFAGAKRWKAGCILLQRPKRRGRSWSRPTRALRYSAATSVALKRCFFFNQHYLDQWVVLHRMRVTTGWHCNPKVGTHSNSTSCHWWIWGSLWSERCSE